MKSGIVLGALLLFLFLLPLPVSAEVRVEKRVEAADIGFGSTIDVTLSITNIRPEREELIVREQVVGADPVSPSEIVRPVASERFIGIGVPYYEWQMVLEPYTQEKIHYSIRPQYVGEHVLGRTRVLASGEQYLSGTEVVSVSCDADAVCDPAIGENIWTCSADCSSGSADNVCDLKADGICDPDCAEGADSDCALGSRESIALPISWPMMLILLFALLPVTGMLLTRLRDIEN